MCADTFKLKAANIYADGQSGRGGHSGALWVLVPPHDSEEEDLVESNVGPTNSKLYELHTTTSNILAFRPCLFLPTPIS